MLLLCHLASMHAMILLDSGFGIPTALQHQLPMSCQTLSMFENRAIRSMPLHVIVHNLPAMNNQVPVRFFEWGVKDFEKFRQ